LIRILALLIFIFIQPSSPSDPPGAIGRFISGASSVLDAGPALWKKIGKFQAEGSVQKVATGATNLEIKKRTLQHDILAARIKNKSELENRVQQLDGDIRKYQNLLIDFSTEVDSASQNEGLDFRVAGEALLTGKDDRLWAVLHKWKPDSPADQKAAADQLGIAIQCSKQISVAASCLEKTVRDGKRDARPECTAESLNASKSCVQEAVPTN
jgi:hypothetical protein